MTFQATADDTETSEATEIIEGTQTEVRVWGRHGRVIGC